MYEHSDLAEELVTRIFGAMTAQLPIANSDPSFLGRERRESTFVSLTLLNRIRDQVRARIDRILFNEDADENAEKRPLRYQDLQLGVTTPAHPYVLYWLLAGLQERNPITGERLSNVEKDFAEAITDARHAYHEVLAVAGDDSRVTDAIRLGYHIAIELEFNPEVDRGLILVALKRLAASQLSGGAFAKVDRMWLARSGDAYGLGIELLNTLLIAARRDPDYLAILEPCIHRSLDWLDLNKVRTPDGVGWVWGEDGADRRPQAWVTGEAYSFLYLAADYFSRAGRIGGKGVWRHRQGSVTRDSISSRL